MAAYLFLDLNAFFAACEQQEAPALRGRPVGVVPVLADGSCLIAVSYAARRYGVKTGTLIADARARVPGLVLVRARPALYVAYHHRIVAAVQECAPVTAIGSIDEMYCRLAGADATPAAALTLAQQIKQRLREQVGEQITASIGIAPNPFLAKVASDMQKPDGLICLLGEELPGPLLRLRPGDLPGIGPRMQQRLAAHGITDITSLYAARAEELRAIWGSIEGERFWHLLRGDDLPRQATRTSSLGHQHVLEPLRRTRAGAMAISQQLLERAARRMRAGGWCCRQLSLEVVGMRRAAGPRPVWQETARHAETQDTLLLRSVLRDLWQRVPDFTPLRVGIVLLDLRPASSQQLDLFTPSAPARLSQILDRINQRWGRETVFFGGTWAVRRVSADKIAFQRVPELAATGMAGDGRRWRSS